MNTKAEYKTICLISCLTQVLIFYHQSPIWVILMYKDDCGFFLIFILLLIPEPVRRFAT